MTNNKVRKILEKINNYQQTINAILSLSHVLRWDNNNKNYYEDSFKFIARKMDTSNHNRISANNTITPDLIVQVNNNYGIVCEAKKSFPKNKDYWLKNFIQLEKYDDDLIGWETEDERIETSDIILLTHLKLSVPVRDYIEEKISRDELKFNNNFSLIGFTRSDELDTIMMLEKRYGKLFNLELDERLRQIERVPLKKIIPLNPIKFYDDKPELPYLMNILWTEIFNQYPEKEDFWTSGGIKIITIIVNLKDITDKLRVQFSDYSEHDKRQQVVPKTKWVKEAMEEFVKLGYAKKENEKNNYKIKYKSIKNPLTKFTEDIYGKKRKKITDYL